MRPEVPPALAVLVRALLAKAPEHRPASAADVAVRLVAFASPEAGGLTPVVQASGTGNPPPRAIPLTGHPSSPSSLVDARANGPERGFTLMAESLPPAPAASLIEAKASPERGFTLMAESLPPTAAPSLAGSLVDTPEHGFTLVAESLPPMPAPSLPPAAAPTPPPPLQRASEHGRPLPPPPQRQTAVPSAGLMSGPAQRRRLIALCIGAGVLGLVLLIGLVFLIQGLMSTEGPRPKGDTPLAQGNGSLNDPEKPFKKTEDPKPEPKKPDDPVKPPPPAPPANKIFTRGPACFLSDLEEFYVQAGPWPFAKNGVLHKEKLIKVSGKPSPKGLSMHPPGNPAHACAKFRLHKEAVLLKTTVAVDDSTNFCWTPAVFTVLGDGKELWTSKTIAHNQPHQRTQDCQVDITGVDVLELRVHCLGHNLNVHAVWVDPCVFQKADSKEGPPVVEGPKDPMKPVVKDKDGLTYLEPNGPKESEGVFVFPTIAPDKNLTEQKPGGKIYLSDLNEFAFKTTPTNLGFAKNGQVSDKEAQKIQVNGTFYPKGLGMHPPNTDYIRVCYALGKLAKTLHGAVALDDGKDPTWQIKTTFFAVLGDGKVLWRSQGIPTKGVVEPFNINVTGVAVLELRVYTDYNGANGSRAVWLDPYLLLE
jgi:hypothetical protein